MLEENLAKARLNIRKANTDGHEVLLTCATKMVPYDIINQLPQYGVNIIGENKVQELLSKYEFVKGLTWHFIGNLQTNKVKYIVDKVAMIHSVDRMSLADEINKQSLKHSKVMDVLIEVNIGGEDSKGGCDLDDLAELLGYVNKLSNIRLCGLMSVLPENCGEELYAQMHDLFKKYRAEYGEQFQYLSMGMSGDYEMAVRNGANLIRLGSCIFGHRDYDQNKIIDLQR